MEKTPQAGGSGTLRIGELLIKAGLVTQAHVEEALAIQARGENYRPLGRILVDSNALSLDRLKAFAEAKQIRPRLGELLLRAKVLTSDDLCLAVEHAKQHKLPLEDALLQRGLCTEEQLKHAQALQLDIEYVNLDTAEIAAFPANLINGNYARKQKICPLRLSKVEITVAMNDPTNLVLQREIAESTELRVRVVISTLPMIMKALTKAYPVVQVKEAEDAGPTDPELELVIDEGFQYSHDRQDRVKALNDPAVQLEDSSELTPTYEPTAPKPKS
jgi:hypothetical protein